MKMIKIFGDSGGVGNKVPMPNGIKTINNSKTSDAKQQQKSAKMIKSLVRRVVNQGIIQVEPGKPGAEVSKKKNYKSKQEFAYRMCTG